MFAGIVAKRVDSEILSWFELTCRGLAMYERLLSIPCIGAALIISSSAYAKDLPAVLRTETERVNFVSTISPHRVIIRQPSKPWRYNRKHPR